MIEEVKTFRLRCDEYDCGAEAVEHASEETDAIDQSAFAYQFGQLLCPQHRFHR